MCLIIIAPKGVAKKSDFLFDSIRKAAVTNKDGIGLAYKWRNSDTIYIDKGYRDVEEFIERLKAMDLSDEEGILAIHLRIGNKGAVNDSMTHPFICSTKEDEVTLLEGDTDKPVLMHNGTFMGLTLPQGKSDTYVFTQKFMSNSHLSSLFYDNHDLFKELFRTVLSVSRVFMLYPGDKDFQMTGTWIEDNGYHFSNETFKNANIKDVGGKIINLNDNSFSDEARPAGLQSKLSLGLPAADSDMDSVAGVIRVVRADFLKDKVLNPKNPEITDELGFTYKLFKGLYANPQVPYSKDEDELEFMINKYNYKHASLQAKIDLPHLNIKDGTYWKITNILVKENSDEQMAVIQRHVALMGHNDNHFIPVHELHKYFSVMAFNNMLSYNYFRSYLDAVAVLNDYKKSLTKYLRVIGDKPDMATVTIKTSKRGEYRFMAGAVRWFIYETKIGHGLSVKKTKEYILNQK